MFAKLKHIAIVSDRFTLLGKFYQSLFGMRSSKPSSDEPRGAIGRISAIKIQCSADGLPSNVSPLTSVHPF